MEYFRDPEMVGESCPSPVQYYIADAEPSHHPGDEVATGSITHREFGTGVGSNAEEGQTSSPGATGKHRDTAPSLYGELIMIDDRAELVFLERFHAILVEGLERR